MNRPTLIPGLSRMWRGPHELQLGAVLLQLPDPRVAGVLDLLDGSRSERMVLVAAAERGIPPAEAQSLIKTLQTAGLALPATALLPPLAEPVRARLISEAGALAQLAPTRPPARTLRRRAASRVVISGYGRLGAGIAVTLAEAGVGHIQPDLPGDVVAGELPGGPLHASDVGRPRRAAVEAAIARAAPGVESVGRSDTSVVVLLNHDQPAALVATAYAQKRQPHLAVAIRQGAAVVGPFVAATGAPCLACLELHRKERDPGWPGLPRPAAPEPCAVTTLLAATAFAAAEVLTFLDGGTPSTLGAAAEIAAAGHFRRRTWPPHPSCDCGPRRPVRTFRHSAGG